jgi:hypothetical protein
VLDQVLEVSVLPAEEEEGVVVVVVVRAPEMKTSAASQ